MRTRLGIFVALILMVALVAGCSQQSDTVTVQTSDSQVKNGDETLGPPSIAIATGSGIVEAGTGMNTQPGSIVIDVPGTAIEQALVYWSGGTDASPFLGDDTIVFGGTEITGELIGGPSYFFGAYEFTAYRADITDLGLVALGPNTIAVSGMDYVFTNQNENNGVGLLVIYSDGSSADIQLVDGLDLAFFNFPEPRQTTVPQTFTFTAPGAEVTADLVFFAGSVGVNRPNEIRVTVGGADQVFTNELGSSDGPLWDTLSLPVVIPADAMELTAELISTPSSDPLGASMSWVAGALSVPIREPETFCLGDFVWHDMNRNGCQDVDEPGMEGVDVRLWVGCPPVQVIGTAVTDADGYYMFCNLEPGDYAVQFMAPGNYVFTMQHAVGCTPEDDSNAAADGITDCVTLVDADDMTIDAGVYVPPTYCIGDFVWYDTNMDGCQNVDEVGIADVMVNLWTGCPPTAVIATTMTDADGFYMFCGLEPGDYTVQFVAPAGHEFTMQYACDPADDSNAGDNGMTDCVTLVDADDLTIDAGLYEPIFEGCTRTKGYWSNWTGLGNGNQPDMVTQHLPIWLGDAGGSKSMQVTDVQMAVDVLTQHTYGAPSNGITKLYAQLLAAKLNFAAGADPSAVSALVTEVDAFLADHDWTDWSGFSRPEKNEINGWKTTLDDYNKGDIGPGHCAEEDDSPAGKAVLWK
ncbi:MAG: SdrD B-like domain-containing protein [bacterium]